MICHINKLSQLAGLVFLLAAGLIAGPPPITITDSGYFATVVDSDGYPSFVRVNVTDLRTGKLPPVTPEDPQPPELQPPPAGISASAAEWAGEVGDAKASQEYALIFETVRDGVVSGDVSSETMFKVLKESADLILNDEWDSFRRRLGDYLTDQLQSGGLLEKKQIADQVELIRYGLAYSAAGSEKLSGGEALGVVSKVNSIIKRLGQ